MAAMAQLRFSPLSGHYGSRAHNSRRQVFSFASPSPLNVQNRSSYLINTPKVSDHNFPERWRLSYAGGDGSNGAGAGRRGGGGGGGDFDDSSSSSIEGFGILGLLLNGWRSRVAADPQFPFKVLMEELVGVSANVLGDMATRPNFGLNELDFVFSTLVVGSIMNFTLMYLLAPTMSSSPSSLPAIFASCPKSHMFEAGPYSIVNRFGTLVYKGVIFAAVGFVAGLAGTAISNGLIAMRKKMDPAFETPNKPPPTLLNALTWGIHMGVSSNFRYQTLNGLEFMLEKGLPPFAFKSSVVALRCVNNVLGGMTFVLLARMTGSQSVAAQKPLDAVVAEKQRLVDAERETESEREREREENLQSNQSTSK